MSNLNSIAGVALSGSLRNQFSAQTVAATTETILQVNTDSGTPVNFYLTLPTGGQVYGSSTGLDNNGNAAIIDRSNYITGLPSGESNDQFNSSSWDGRMFKIRAAGIGNAGANAAQTVQVNLYQGSSATVASNKKIGTTGTGLAAVAGGAFNFAIEATLLWDATSGILSGSYTSNVAFGTVSQFTTTTVVPNVVTSVTAAGLVFNATLVLGNAASSTVTLREFVADRV
jgi:hypothetical protein